MAHHREAGEMTGRRRTEDPLRDTWAIVPLSDGQYAEALAITSDLREWFTPTGLANLAKDLKFQVGVAAMRGERLVGFLCYYSEQGVGHIGWLAVNPGLHRQGIGRALVQHVIERLQHAGISEVRVETLGDAVAYEPYARTRAFYRALGFVDYQRITQDNPECEELLILRRAIP
ncbi:MAG: GNAT family N-acetyltransferase [Phycisphaerales bacterium]